MQKSRIAYIAILPIYYDIVGIEKQPRTHLSVTWIKVFEIVQLGDLIGTRTRVCAVRGRRPNR